MQLKLDRFVLEIYKQMNIMPKNMSCVIKSFVMTNPGIREYAWENKFDYICISTRGAGKLKRIFGTNTSNLINFSEVPVIAVPYSYRTKKVASIMYASDLTNLESELKKVVEFAKPLKAKVELLHFSSPSELSATSNTIESAVKSFSKYNVKLHIEKPKLIDSMVSNLESAIKKSKPSMMIMFIEQNRSFFERLFLPSKSAEYSFEAKVPLLVYSKT